MLLPLEQVALVPALPCATPSIALSSYLTHRRPVVAVKKLRLGLLESVEMALQALVSKLLSLPAAVLPPLLARVLGPLLAPAPPAVLKRTEPATLQAPGRAQLLLVQVQV